MTTTIALVGGAHIHTPGFIEKINARPDLQVKYVWDHDPHRANTRAGVLKAQVAKSSSQIWDDKTVSAVIICSETSRHGAYAFSAAASNKHLFIEKPLGMGASDAYRMATAIQQAGVIFQTGYFMRGNPIHLLLKSLIESRSFGTITRFRHTNCHSGSLGGWFDTDWRWMTDLSQSGCGAFGDLGTHSLDILLWLMGSVERVTADLGLATRRYGECDEFGEGLLEFKGGSIGSLAAGWVDIAHPVSLILSGTEGHAYVVDGQLFLQSEKIAGADGKTPYIELPPAWPHAFDNFLDAITGKEHAPLVTVQEAAYRSAIMEALYTGARTHTWVTPENG